MRFYNYRWNNIADDIVTVQWFGYVFIVSTLVVGFQKSNESSKNSTPSISIVFLGTL